MNANRNLPLPSSRALVKAGVPQADIWIGDPSRAVTDNISQAITRAFPESKWSTISAMTTRHHHHGGRRIPES